MPWLQPKVDWSGEDGVTNDDFNRIEGNLQHLFDTKANQAASVVTYYVSPNGSDANTGLTSAEAFASIQKAIDMIPKELGGATVTINVASGTYTGFTLANFSGGAVNLNFGNADVIVNSAVSINNCHAVHINGTGSFQCSDLLRVFNTHSFLCAPDTTATRTGGNAVEVVQSRAVFTTSLTVTTSTFYNGLLIDQSSLCFVESLLSMPGSGIGIKADRGSVAAYGSYNNRASVEVATARGGRVYSGSQGLGGIS